MEEGLNTIVKLSETVKYSIMHLGKQLRKAIALGRYELKSDDIASNAVNPKHLDKRCSNFRASNTKILSKKEIKKEAENKEETSDPAKHLRIT